MSNREPFKATYRPFEVKGSGSVGGFLIAILRNGARASKRKGKGAGVNINVVAGIPSKDKSPLDAVLAAEWDAELPKRIHDGLAKLSERERQAVTLIFMEGMTFRDAAAQMGVALGTFEGSNKKPGYYKRAMAKLRRLLQGLNPE